MAGNPKRRQQEQELAERLDELCDLLRGGASDKQAMKEMGFPSAHPMYALAKREESVRLALVRAREDGAHAMSSEVLDLADELVLIPKVDPIRVAQLQMDARKWLAGKRNAQFADSKAAIGVQVNVGALHLQALKAVAAPVERVGADVVDAVFAPVVESGEALTLDDLL